MAHPEGEVAVAKACAKTGTPMGLSSYSNCTIEQISENNSNPKFFQIYMNKIKKVNLDLWNRAKKAGFLGFILTCDL